MRHARTDDPQARGARPPRSRREQAGRRRGRHFHEEPPARVQPARLRGGLQLFGTGVGVVAAVAATAAFTLTSTGGVTATGDTGERGTTRDLAGTGAERSAPRVAPPVVVDRSATISRSEDRAERGTIRPADPTVVSAADDTPPLPGCDAEVTEGWANGQLPSDQLCAPWEGSVLLRADAARAMAELNRAYTARFGERMCITDGYRSYDLQVSTKAAKGYLAAAPGTSNHGWGLAVDLCPETYTGERGEWLAANAPVAGWENPQWARAGGSKYEPWHWEFVPGVQGVS